MNRRFLWFRCALAALCPLLLWNCGGGDDEGCGCGADYVKLHGETEKAWKLERAARYAASGDSLLSESPPTECEADDRLVLNEARAWFSRYGATPCAAGGPAGADGPQNDWTYSSRDALLILKTEGAEPVVWTVEDLAEERLVLRRETEGAWLEHVYAAAP